MDALHNIAKSLSLQENVHFINDIPTFKDIDPQSFDDWWDQINNVAAQTNNDPNKLTLAKSQGSFSKTIYSYSVTLGWKKIKEHLCYNFGSVATKQHATSMLIDEQQKPSETLQEYIQRFLDLLLKSSGLLPHQAKRPSIHYAFYQKLQHYVLGKNPTSVKNAFTLAHKKDAELKKYKDYVVII